MEVDDYVEDGEVDEEEEHESKHSTKTQPSENIQNIFPISDPDTFRKRAERFGLKEEDAVKPITRDQMIALYKELEVPDDEITKILAGSMDVLYRLQAIHVCGTDEMSTKDLFDYFSGYNPSSIEWINDSSCNMVWLEPWQAARAMLERSTEVVKSEGKNAEHENEEMDQEAPDLPSNSGPSSGAWRKGFPTPKAENLYFRFATKNDCKVKGAQNLSMYYLKHGNPHFGETKGGLVSTSRKRRIEEARSGKIDPASLDSKNPWGSLALEWGTDEQESFQKRFEEDNTHRRGLSSHLVRRLGHEPPRPSPSRSRDTDSEQSDGQDSSASDSESESASTRKRIRMRMYADEEETKQQKKKTRQTSAADFGSKLAELRSSRVHERLGPVSDLRSKIKKRLS